MALEHGSLENQQDSKNQDPVKPAGEKLDSDADRKLKQVVAGFGETPALLAQGIRALGFVSDSALWSAVQKRVGNSVAAEVAVILGKSSDEKAAPAAAPVADEKHAPVAPVLEEKHAPAAPVLEEKHAPVAPVLEEKHAPAPEALPAEVKVEAATPAVRKKADEEAVDAKVATPTPLVTRH